jgi:hypothetical protein
MRVLVESLAELMGVELAPVDLPARPPHSDRSYDIALADLRDVIVPRAGDQQAQQKAKGLVRMIKYWRAVGDLGPTFDVTEARETSHALDRKVADAREARRLLADAVAAHEIEPSKALQLVHRRMARETALMADAMGRFAETHYAPLE